MKFHESRNLNAEVDHDQFGSKVRFVAAKKVLMYYATEEDPVAWNASYPSWFHLSWKHAQSTILMFSLLSDPRSAVGSTSPPSPIPSLN